VKLRRARPDELEPDGPIQLLDRELLPLDKRHDFEADDLGVWVVYSGPELAAYGAAMTSKHKPGLAFLSRAGVALGYRGLGLQRRLIRARLRAVRAAGLAGAWTYTVDNPASANSLIACGFRSISCTFGQGWLKQW
jgi:GNAT superfamily N-acetyltransferase